VKEPSPHVIVHGGVHKTATSYVQSILRRNAGALAKRGTLYVHHRHTRKELTIPSQLNGYMKLGLNYRTKVSDEELAERSQVFFKGLKAKAGQRVILSDENMAGHCGHCVTSGVLYNRRKTLLPAFAGAMAWPVNEVHLAVRNYADFFASAYVEFLRSAQPPRVVPDTVMKTQVLSRMPSWLGLLRDVRKAFPEARLIVWRHEDFRQLRDRVLDNLAGPGAAGMGFAMPKNAKVRPTASGKAVEELLRLVASAGAETALARRVEIQERYPRGDIWPGYDPWSAQERAHLTRLYERDWQDILREPGLEPLLPDGVKYKEQNEA
jgi:hypothetical protein